jgi:type VI secretion system secreted protein VgrG
MAARRRWAWSSVFKGTIMAMASITATTGASVEGRLLARTAAVTLDNNAVRIATAPASCQPPWSCQPRPAAMLSLGTFEILAGSTITNTGGLA